MSYSKPTPRTQEIDDLRDLCVFLIMHPKDAQARKAFERHCYPELILDLIDDMHYANGSKPVRGETKHDRDKRLRAYYKGLGALPPNDLPSPDPKPIPDTVAISQPVVDEDFTL